MSETVSDPVKVTPVYVRSDEHGAMRVADTPILLDGLIAAFWSGESAEAMQLKYPTLTLEQVYGAIAYYLGHRAEVDEYMNRQRAEWERFRAESEANPSPVMRRLRALASSSARRAS